MVQWNSVFLFFLTVSLQYSIFIIFQLHKCPLNNTLIVLSPGMLILTTYVAGYNKTVFSLKGSDFMMSVMLRFFYQAVLENVIIYGIDLWTAISTVQLKSRISYSYCHENHGRDRTSIHTLQLKSQWRGRQMRFFTTIKQEIPICRFKILFISSWIKLLNNIM